MHRTLRLLLLAPALTLAAPSSGATVLFAGGSWAAVKRGDSCEAASKSVREARRGQQQARAGLAFDSAGPRHGQFYALLSRMPRDGAAVLLRIGDRPFLLVRSGQWAWSTGPAQEAAIIAALRGGGWMHVESRSASGRRFRDYYALAGAPTAIDAAAAGCAVAKPGAGP